MSHLVLHMDKFKRESLRGIQSHNRRERRSHTNPDIRSEKNGENYELHQPEVSDYVRAVQSRIDSLNLPKAVRKGATRHQRTEKGSSGKGHSGGSEGNR